LIGTPADFAVTVTVPGPAASVSGLQAATPSPAHVASNDAANPLKRFMLATISVPSRDPVWIRASRTSESLQRATRCAVARVRFFGTYAIGCGGSDKSARHSRPAAATT